MNFGNSGLLKILSHKMFHFNILRRPAQLIAINQKFSINNNEALWCC